MRLAAIELPGGIEPWTDLGFAADDVGRIRLANGALALGATTAGLVISGDGDGGGGVRDGGGGVAEIEGIPIRVGEPVAGAAHPNGAVELDHLVIMTNSLDRTSGVVEEVLDLRCRRVRETTSVRQAFHRFDDVGDTRGCIVEIVESSPAERTEIWGLVVIVADLDGAVEEASGSIGHPTPAVQPGRRIATVSRAAGLPTAVALMSR